MGCFTSKPSPLNGKAKPSKELAGKSEVKKGLTQKEIQMRIEAPEISQTFIQNDVTIKYAWVTQRGYYPDQLDKENQDSYSISPKIIVNDDGKKFALFGVYDGHGNLGDLCSQYASTELPKNLVQKLKEAQNGGLKETEKAILKAHKITNDSMHADTSIDTSLSGTTSVTVLFHEKTMFVSNVGDSRAIVVSTDIEGIKVHAMSSDQTPYRKDERFRVMKYGARVLSVQQVLQNDISVQDNWGNITLGDEIDEAGDPPRVWSQEGDFPGTAFTRSFGDQIAEELGVTAEPEILVRDVDSHDKYVVIASDGVFEFLTNQMVADIVAEKEDPLEACHAVVAAAYDLWLRFDVRTDDITIVILQFMDMVPGPLSEEKASPKNLSFQNQFFSSARIFNSRQPPPVTPSASVLNESRPVRRVISREKRKKITFTPIYEREGCNQNISTTETHSVAVLKSEKDAQAIGGAIKLNFLFQHLNVAERNELISFMQPMTVKAGDWVIKQGDEGNNFYVIDHGRFEVRVKPDGSDDINGGSVVHVYESGKDQHPGFGELALLYGKPRAASVIALTDSSLWYVDKQVFTRIVVRSIDSHKLMKRILRKVQIFSCLSLEQIRTTTALMSVIRFAAGEYMLREGVRNENFYIILEGECESSTTAENEFQKECILKKSDYFGEYALLAAHELARRTVVAKTDVKLLFVSRHEFENHLGPLLPKLESHKTIRLATLNRADVPKSFTDVEVKGLTSSDGMGSILLGTFGPAPCRPNLTLRCYILKDVDRLKVSAAVLNAIEAYKVITASSKKNCFVFRLLTVFHEPNALLLVLNVPVVADLDSFLRSRTNDNTLKTTKDVVIYVATCVFSALDFVHNLGIIYRSVQPESMYVDVNGRIVLGGFRVSKVGKVGGKTYTITGITDYLAPEQLSRQGHSAPVDLWALGVVLFELATGGLPFAEETELATYQKISSYGTSAFPKLTYPEDTPAELIYVIEKLLVPVPEMRLGAGPKGYVGVKQTFEGIDWETFHTDPPVSPLAAAASVILDDMAHLGVEPKVLAVFSEEHSGDEWSKTVHF